MSETSQLLSLRLNSHEFKIRAQHYNENVLQVMDLVMNETWMSFGFTKSVSATYLSVFMVTRNEMLLHCIHYATGNDGKRTCGFKYLREVTGLGRNAGWGMFPWHLVQSRVNEGHREIWVGQWIPNRPADKGLPTKCLR